MAVLSRTSPSPLGRLGRCSSVLFAGVGVTARGRADAHLAGGDTPRSGPARGRRTVIPARIVGGSPLRGGALGRRTCGPRETRFRSRSRLSGAGVSDGSAGAQSALLTGGVLPGIGRVGSR